METDEARAGKEINMTNIKIRGAKAIFQFLDTNTTANPPNKAGRILSKAGASSSDSRIGCKGANKRTPRKMITMVVMDETAMEIVEITSPSSVPDFTLAKAMALMAQGTLRLVKFPVTNPR